MLVPEAPSVAGVGQDNVTGESHCNTAPAESITSWVEKSFVGQIEA